MSAVLQSPAPTLSAPPNSKPAQTGNTPPPVLLSLPASVVKRARRINWELVWARCLQVAWTVFAKGPLIIVYFVFISEGIRRRIPEAAEKLSALPFPLFAHLEDYEGTHELDVANVGAAVMLLFSYVSWWFLLSWVIKPELKERMLRWRWAMLWIARLLLTVAVVIIVADAGLFYISVTQNIFGSSAFSPSACIATLAYAVILVMVNFVSLYLSRSAREIKEKGLVQS